ncbi:alpha/beta hydrolase [Candidatus Uhrbacteria bacterium]|nr:alpha/beta hydrolase [Candidatus Uhrbacteria bacterium]
MDKIFIKNRKGQRVAAVVESAMPQRGLVFVMHGLGGFKESDQTRATVEPFIAAGYTAVSFDTTNTFGESDGNYENATTTNYCEDLEDVIAWAGSQSWYQEPFVLAGHSLGGLCTALYAQKHPEQVKGLAPLSTVVSGALSLESPEYKKHADEWKRTGWRVTESASKPGHIKRLKWSHVEDRLKYDLLPDAHKLTMPVLLVVGENDESCPPNQQKILYEALSGPKELHVIKNAPHTFRQTEHLQELKEILAKWIARLV